MDEWRKNDWSHKRTLGGWGAEGVKVRWENGNKIGLDWEENNNFGIKIPIITTNGAPGPPSDIFLNIMDPLPLILEKVIKDTVPWFLDSCAFVDGCQWI